jgi:hypothetical protein
MTYHPSLTRRGLLQSTAIGATPLSVLGQPDADTDDANGGSGETSLNSNPVPETDLIEDYLGVTALSYDDPSGELTYRVDDDDPDITEDCVYRIGQTLAVQDGDKAGHQHDAEELIIDARFELHLTASESAKLPALYREYESTLDGAENDNNDEAISTSQLSIKSYPGILTHYDETAIDEQTDELNVLWYIQSFPWGMLYWDVIYDPAASVSLEVDPHHEQLRERRDRDWDVPSLATKRHWQEVHLGDRSGKTGKGRYSGDISPILSHTGAYDESDLERVDERLWTTNEPTQSAVVALNTYR